jgi:hypothetical protein
MNRKERKRLARLLREAVDEAYERGVGPESRTAHWQLAYRGAYWAERLELPPHEFTRDIATTLVYTPIPMSDLARETSKQYPNAPHGPECDDGDPLSFPSGWRLLAQIRYAKQPTIAPPFPGRRGPLQQPRQDMPGLRMYMQGLIQRDVQ